MFSDFVRGFPIVIHSVLRATKRRPGFIIELFPYEYYTAPNVDKHGEEAVQVDLDWLFVPHRTRGCELARATDLGCPRIRSSGDSWRVGKLLL
jgi:hypothetical protein